MKRILLFLLLCLLTAGCAKEPALSEVQPAVPSETEAAAPTEAPTEAATLAPREEHVTLTLMSEGLPYPVDATLYRGDGYSIYLPDGDWTPVGEDLWEYAWNPQVSIGVIDYFDFSSREEVQAALEGNGFVPESRNKLVLLDNGFRNEIILLNAGSRVRGFTCLYPDTTEFIENMGAVQEMILDSFLWE